MELALRVLAAHTQGRSPEAADADQLRGLFPGQPDASLASLAREIIAQGVNEHAAARKRLTGLDT